MLNIILYSNDSRFLTSFYRGVSARLPDYAKEICRFSRQPLFQTRLDVGDEPSPDLCVADIRDDPVRGMDFVRQLRANSGCEVMVIAPGPDWAMDAYNADVLSYLTDPPDPARAAGIILRRFSRMFRPEEAQFSFRTTSGIKLFPGDRIVFVEYSGHRLLIHTDSGKPVATSTMRVSFGEAAAKLLEDPRFVRTHVSFLVNINHITQFGQYAVTMDTGDTVPVSHARRTEVKRQFNRFFAVQAP